jgi:hypothetical protein
VVFRLLPEGFARDLRALLARQLGVTPGTLTSGSLTYPLRRLRLTASSRASTGRIGTA